MIPALVDLVEGMEPVDALEAEHLAAARAWLRSTDDVYRRAKPSTPDPHLVSYFLLVDRPAGSVLLCDHRLSGLRLPTGGHVEPGEDPRDTVRREAAEELGIAPRWDALTADAPFLLTATRTIGDAAGRHTDVSLWFALEGATGMALDPDPREFEGVRWWSAEELRAGTPPAHEREPHLLRALDALGL